MKLIEIIPGKHFPICVSCRTWIREAFQRIFYGRGSPKRIFCTHKKIYGSFCSNNDTLSYPQKEQRADLALIRPFAWPNWIRMTDTGQQKSIDILTKSSSFLLMQSQAAESTCRDATHDIGRHGHAQPGEIEIKIDIALVQDNTKAWSRRAKKLL